MIHPCSSFAHTASVYHKQNIKEAEDDLLSYARLDSGLSTVKDDINDKISRRDRLKRQIAESGVSERIAELSSELKSIETKRDLLNAELGTISAVAETRAERKVAQESHREKSLELAKL